MALDALTPASVHSLWSSPKFLNRFCLTILIRLRFSRLVVHLFLVMWSSTPRFQSLCQKKETLKCFIRVWFVLPKAFMIYDVRSFIYLKTTWHTTSAWFKRSEPHLISWALFTSFRELTLTDHRFNSWVYVWFIWIIFVAVHRQKWMNLTMAIIFIQ